MRIAVPRQLVTVAAQDRLDLFQTRQTFVVGQPATVVDTLARAAPGQVQ